MVCQPALPLPPANVAKRETNGSSLQQRSISLTEVRVKLFARSDRAPEALKELFEESRKELWANISYDAWSLDKPTVAPASFGYTSSARLIVRSRRTGN